MLQIVLGAMAGGGKFTAATHNSSICALAERVRAVHVHSSGHINISFAAPMSLWVYEMQCVGGST